MDSPRFFHSCAPVIHNSTRPQVKCNNFKNGCFTKQKADQKQAVYFLLQIGINIHSRSRRHLLHISNIAYQRCHHRKMLAEISAMVVRNFLSQKFKFSVSGKKNICLFGVATKTSVSCDKTVTYFISTLVLLYCLDFQLQIKSTYYQIL